MRAQAGVKGGAKRHASKARASKGSPVPSSHPHGMEWHDPPISPGKLGRAHAERTGGRVELRAQAGVDPQGKGASDGARKQGGARAKLQPIWDGIA